MKHLLCLYNLWVADEEGLLQMQQDQVWADNYLKNTMPYRALLLMVSICTGIVDAEAPAAASGIADELAFLQAERYVITATKTLEEVNKTGMSVTVISAETIRRMGARNLVDILKTVPGLGVTQNNLGAFEYESRGVKSSFSSKVLFLIDNLPAGIHLLNHGPKHAFQGFSIHNIKRVEIVRGPGSALYGADSFLATINLITKGPEDIDGFSASVRGGSFDTQEYNLQFGRQFDEFGIAGNVFLLDSNGFRGDLAGDINGSAGETILGEAKHGIDFKANYADLHFQTNYVGRKGRGGFVGILLGINDETIQRYYDVVSSVRYEWAVDDKWNVVPRAYVEYWKQDNFYEGFNEGESAFGVFPPGFFPNGTFGPVEAQTLRYGADVLTTYDWLENNKVVFGQWYEHQEFFDLIGRVNFDENNNFFPTPNDVLVPLTLSTRPRAQRDVFAIFAEDIWDITEDIRLILGARFDRYSDFGEEFHPRANLVWEFSDGYFLKLLYGSAFRAPNFSDQFEVNVAYAANPDVQPEDIDTFEFGLTGEVTEEFTVSITGFYNDIKDLISSEIINARRTVSNSGELQIWGMELNGRYRFLDFDERTYIGFNYTLLDIDDAKAVAGAPGGTFVRDVPEHRGNIILNLGLPMNLNWYLNLHFKGEVERSATDARSDLGGYMLVNTAISSNDLFGHEGVSASLSIFNLLDKQHFDPSPVNSTTDYEKPGITVLLQLSYQF
ncbi:MAG: TonB-dependent receptor [Planctomycetota bacterium]|nr:TonB-dependent receptor [Planctomycetota bacterium]